jgi:molybdopterin-guanine dinucleotide biosynthesis protein A
MLAPVGGSGEQPIGAILAGGQGRRIGGQKALLELGGRALVSWPLRTMQRVLRDVIVVAKPSTDMPAMPGTIVWREPAEPQHPLMGIVAGLRAARGRPVLVCALDTPFVREKTLRVLAAVALGDAVAAVAVGGMGSGMHPLLARYEAAALPALEAALNAQEPLRETVARLSPVWVGVRDDELLNVNTPEELEQARGVIELGEAADRVPTDHQR